MPGLVRGVARTAAVAGTATAVSGRVRRRQEARFAQQDAPAAAQQAPVYQEPTPPPAPPAGDPLDRLKTLGELKAQGVLTEAEFQAQKAKILAG